tara:strand:+ start:1000 stop:1224 length:225 start_codon:yes stop_codon:yes gene_type:complete
VAVVDGRARIDDERAEAAEAVEAAEAAEAADASQRAQVAPVAPLVGMASETSFPKSRAAKRTTTKVKTSKTSDG